MEKLNLLILMFLIAITTVIIILTKSKRRIVIGLITGQNEVSYEGKSYELVYSPDYHVIDNPIYIKYYDSLKKMIVLMYEENIGYVLTPEDRELPKFYHISEVYIAPINTSINGYIKDDEFYILSTVD